MIGFEDAFDARVEIIEIEVIWHFLVLLRNYLEIGTDQF